MNKIMHITKERFDDLTNAARYVGRTYIGSRQQDKNEIEYVRDNYPRLVKECNKLPKKYRLVVHSTINLGSSKFPCFVRGYEVYEVDDYHTIRETDNSLIYETKNCYTKKVINKDKVLFYIW